jgi:hypothetical protein
MGMVIAVEREVNIPENGAVDVLSTPEVIDYALTLEGTRRALMKRPG